MCWSLLHHLSIKLAPAKQMRLADMAPDDPEKDLLWGLPRYALAPQAFPHGNYTLNPTLLAMY